MSRQNQAQKQRKAEALKLHNAYVPVDNVIKTPVRTKEELLKLYPLYDLGDSNRERLKSHWAGTFDFTLIDKAIYENWWSTYDTSEYLFVFLAVDGSIMYVSNYSCPFSDDDKETYYHECTPEQAKYTIDRMIKDCDDLINDEAINGSSFCF